MTNKSSGWRRLLLVLVAISAIGSATYIYLYGPAYPDEADVMNSHIAQIIDTLYEKPEHGLEAFQAAIDGGANPEQFVDSQEPRLQESLETWEELYNESLSSSGQYSGMIREMNTAGYRAAKLRLEMLGPLRDQHELELSKLPERQREAIIQYVFILLGPIVALLAVWMIGGWIRCGFQSQSD